MFILNYVLLSAVIGVICVFTLYFYTKKKDAGSKEMQEISKIVQNGAMAFLKKEYSILAIFGIIVAVILYFLINPLTSLSFIFGALSSAFAGFIGMKAATTFNVRTTQAAKKGLKQALRIAFSSGLIMSLTCVSLALFGVTILYIFLKDVSIIFGFSLGASSIALFARVGGGIFTKAADVGADLVGKVEKGIPEDDPRNPAVIADNVGDNVGDVAGMGADLFESYVGSLISALAIGFFVFKETGIYFPLALAAVGLISSIIGSFFVRSKKSPEMAFMNGLIVSSILVAVSSFFLVRNFFPDIMLFFVICIGLLTGILIGINTLRYTSAKYKYVKGIVKASETGPATTVIEGLSVGMRSTKNTVIIISLAIFFSYSFGGLYGIAIAALAMLSTLGISLAIDAYGPVADNAGGIAEMTHQPPNVRKTTDILDAAGNSTAAMGKGFAIGSAALTSLALFSAFVTAAGISSINLTNPKILVGVFIGGMLPFLFSAQTMRSVGKAAFQIVKEVRRQFKNPNIMKGKTKPDYNRCILISTHAALKEMIAPGLLAILTPIATGLLLGAEALGGLLIGALVTAIALAIMLANSGGAWDNAKKSIEAMTKKTKEWKDLHAAAVIGDTIGDPFKDTSGPSLNILIKLMSIVALIFAPLFANSLF